MSVNGVNIKYKLGQPNVYVRVKYSFRLSAVVGVRVFKSKPFTLVMDLQMLLNGLFLITL